MCNKEFANCHDVGKRPKDAGVKDADFVFYISAIQTERCQKGATVAYAAHCQQESVTERYFHPSIFFCCLLITFISLLDQLLDMPIYALDPYQRNHRI